MILQFIKENGDQVRIVRKDYDNEITDTFFENCAEKIVGYFSISHLSTNTSSLILKQEEIVELLTGLIYMDTWEEKPQKRIFRDAVLKAYKEFCKNEKEF